MAGRLGGLAAADPLVGASGFDTAVAGGAVGRPDFAGAAGGSTGFRGGAVEGTRMTSEMTAEASSAGVARFTTIGRAPGWGGAGMRSVLAVAASSTEFPAGVE